MTQHALERTSPKGTPFIGTCTKCGTPGLTFATMRGECANPGGLSQDDALLLAIRGDAAKIGEGHE